MEGIVFILDKSASKLTITEVFSASPNVALAIALVKLEKLLTISINFNHHLEICFCMRVWGIVKRLLGYTDVRLILHGVDALLDLVDYKYAALILNAGDILLGQTDTILVLLE
jgi:hypothetical protein